MSDTITTDEAQQDAPTIPTDDLIAATTQRWKWQNDDNFASSVERNRSTRDRKALAFVAIARTIADNDLPWPIVDQYVYGRDDSAVVVVSYRVDELSTFRLLARAVRRAVGGLQTKSNEDGSLTATVVSSDGLVAWEVMLAASSSPCEQVQVGTETKVTREEVTPPRYREVEKEVPVFEWKCPPSVLDADLLAEAEQATSDDE